MKNRRLIAFAAVFGAGYLSAVLLPPQHPPGDVPRMTISPTAEDARTPVEDRLAQADFGTRCSTPQGVCGLPQPQPIGSVCYCDGTRGSTIR